MVMDTTPSPKQVGREFVRVYYTLLHEAPSNLHRFYSHNSSFVHGGVEKPGEEQAPVIGQVEIHKKIMSLGFRNCHARIRQVDAQATINNAVVVQVSGELSNDEQPMRRFMQTFVLAPQTPKKFYVHNDIFRYQDEAFHDYEDEDEEAEQQQAADSEPEEDKQMSNMSVEADVPDIVPPTSAPLPLSNGLSSGGSPCTSHGGPSPSVVDGPPTEEMYHQPQEPTPVVQSAVVVTPTVDPQLDYNKPEADQMSPHIGSGNPLTSPDTWAHVTGRHTGGQGGVSPSKPPPAKPASVEASPEAQPAKKENTESPPARSFGGGRGGFRGGRSGSSGPREGGGGGGAPRVTGVFPDNQQVFVGNIPNDADEDELKQLFEGYGKVREIRLNRNAKKGAPNFAFVIFFETESVDGVLGEAKRIMIRENIRLNVEAKKRNVSSSRGPPRSGGRGGGGGAPRGRGGIGPRRGGGGGFAPRGGGANQGSNR